MIFNKHSELKDRHSFLSPSKYHWINYDDEKLDRVFNTYMTAHRGTELHAFAAEAIRLGILQRKTRQTLNQYVNDAIGYKLIPEQTLFYSVNAFGTADAVGFRKNVLRIFDLKNGVTPASMKQLYVYAALFCLEYGFKPHEITMDLRIYQNDAVEVADVDPAEILYIMDKIVAFDRRITQLRMEAQA